MKTRVSGKAQPAKTVFIIAVLVFSFAACLYYGLFNSRTAASQSEAESTENSGDYLAFRDDQKNGCAACTGCTVRCPVYDSVCSDGLLRI